MKTKLASRISLLLAAVLSNFTALTHAQSPPDVSPLPSHVRVGGLNVSLTTSGYRFAVPSEPAAVDDLVDGGTVTVARAFVASAELRNRTRGNVAFEFPDTASAAQKFKFRVFNSEGVQVWESDADAVGADVPTTETLRRGAMWRRVVRVPLVIDGVPLRPGVYSLQAAVEADKQPGASLPFVVVERRDPHENTGIVGKVVLVDGDVVSPAVGAVVRIHQIIPPNVRLAHPPFSWTGRTNEDGGFRVNTQPGRFKVVATYFRPVPAEQDAAAIFREEVPVELPLTAAAEVAVEAGQVSEVVLRLKVPPPPPTAQGISGLVLIGPISPVEVEGQPNERPLPGARVIVEQLRPEAEVAIVAPPLFRWEGVTNAEGRFKVRTPVGKFKVTAKRALPHPVDPPIVRIGVVRLDHEPATIGSDAVEFVSVAAGEVSEVTLHIDSGIR